MWTVTKSTAGNDNVCDADCSLREAVFKAVSGDTVIFSPNSIGQTFTLGSSQIAINNQITIDGNIDGNIDGVHVVFISGENESRFFLSSNSSLILKNAILVNGNGKPDQDTPQNLSEGGAINTFDANLTLERVAVRGNTAKFSGAILFFHGTHIIKNRSITGNTAQTDAAFRTVLNTSIYMSNATVSGNFCGRRRGNRRD